LNAVLVVQERLRLYRESMTACLRRQLDGIEVAAGARDAAELREMAEREQIAHAVIEADKVPWSVGALAAALHQQNPDVQVIGLFASARPPICEGVVLLPRGTSPEQVADLVQPGKDRPVQFVLTAASTSAQGPLTGQQLRILALLSLGFTVTEVASRLGLSERGVTKSKVAIFAKLGVQSQAQAVAKALATGLLGPASASTLP
jgi:DNA-binding CsgD family transcriptional regulator